MKTPFWPVPIGSKPIDLGLERVTEALEKMGNPHLKLPPVIHIAGTNGKGSTLAFLRAILEAEGYKCHIYTSPHLVEFNERIVVAGQKISDEFLTEILQETKNLSQGTNLTFFEGTTLAAILAFSKIKADFVLLETGMGGRLDATNIIPNPLLNIITPISYDHTEFLGDTLSKIAYEKACIMRKNTPCIIAKQEVEALEIIKKTASEIGSKPIICGEDFDFKILENGEWIFENKSTPNSQLPAPNLFGNHQYHNSAVAIRSALEINNLGYKISENSIKKGIQNAVWPARLQDIRNSKLGEFLSPNDELYLDGSHNPQGAETLADFLNSKVNQAKENHIIIGMLANKDSNGFFKILAEKLNQKILIHTISIPEENNSQTPEKLKEIAEKYFITTAEKNLENAIQNIKNNSKNENRIIICGSLYLAGFVLENYIKETF
ncbi:MAG: folylpolyglutamate synthase/dihydrofolate synthase family protein [Rickettsiales bacterium]|nr:folylpolyglutamate synthase/dihydrofolate synthase family protein [Rickettsiales bacterium]